MQGHNHLLGHNREQSAHTPRVERTQGAELVATAAEVELSRTAGP